VGNNNIEYDGNVSGAGGSQEQEMALIRAWLAAGANPADRPETAYFDNRFIDSLGAGGPSAPPPVPFGQGSSLGETEIQNPIYRDAVENIEEGGRGVPDLDLGGGTVRDPGPSSPYAGGGGGSWNWDAFDPNGGVNEVADPFAGMSNIGVPGRDSPWGDPNQAGGNQEFYAQQFANLLRQGNNYQQQAQDANQRRQDAFANPAPETDYQAMWAEMGITPTEPYSPSAGDSQYGYGFNSGLGGAVKPGETTNFELFNLISPLLSEGDVSSLTTHFNDNPATGEGLNWAQAKDPTNLISQLGNQGDLGPEFRETMTNLFNTIYTRNDTTTPAGGGPTPATGYAAPI
jgi:hypothetical protein